MTLSNSTGTMLAHNNSVTDLIQRNTGRRRASVAVWSDEKLMAMVNHVNSGLNSGKASPSIGGRRPSSKDRWKTSKSTSMVTSASTELQGTLEAQQQQQQQQYYGIMPEAAMIRILNYLQITQRVQLRSLSKSIDNLILSEQQKFARIVDFSGINKTCDDKFIKSFVTVYGHLIEHLNLRNCWGVADEGVLAIAANCPHLKYLCLMGCWDVTDASVTTLAESCGEIEFIDFSNCRKLGDEGLAAIMANCTKISNISLSYCKNISNDIFAFPQRWFGIEHLNLQRCTGITDDGFAKIEGMELALKTLSLSDCSFLTSDTINYISSSCSLLKNLSLSFCCALNEDFASKLIEGCKKLEVLDVSFCGNAITDNSIEILLKGLTNLQKLNVRGCAQLTDTGANHIILNGLNLKTLNISQCKGISKNMENMLKRKFILLEVQVTLNPHEKHGTPFLSRALTR